MITETQPAPEDVTSSGIESVWDMGSRKGKCGLRSAESFLIFNSYFCLLPRAAHMEAGRSNLCELCDLCARPVLSSERALRLQEPAATGPIRSMLVTSRAER